ncbi:hypothetical protein [Heyndrickxia camelliae]|uniref:Uncharacterized protein n=1 Tax=Heyndrickxia camelliae TaxID=1707093 RepID=A0A2N3LCS4_9BACI|nr:hypothetical protein [Heyndrickxia camelliae]PKR82411.1 hypothetical protein CWO92_24655 [Heyndrickxia camelliae]
MLANIEQIDYIQDQEGFHIIVEFSKLPIESFNTKEEAEKFIIGYKTGLNMTESMRHGLIFRNFVEMDLKAGVKYRKVNVPELELVK